MRPKLVILDRDGVINHDSDQYIKTVDEFIPYADSLLAISYLNQAGIAVVVASNQSGLSRQFFSLDTLHRMHHKLEHELDKVKGKIDKIYFCPHGPDDDCECRKPKPGMLKEILSDYKLLGHEVVFVGDSFRDLEAAKRSDIPSVLVRTGKGVQTDKKISLLAEYASTPVFDNLLDYINHLL